MNELKSPEASACTHQSQPFGYPALVLPSSVNVHNKRRQEDGHHDDYHVERIVNPCKKERTFFQSRQSVFSHVVLHINQSQKKELRCIPSCASLHFLIISLLATWTMKTIFFLFRTSYLNNKAVATVKIFCSNLTDLQKFVSCHKHSTSLADKSGVIWVEYQ